MGVHEISKISFYEHTNEHIDKLFKLKHIDIFKYLSKIQNVWNNLNYIEIAPVKFVDYKIIFTSVNT